MLLKLCDFCSNKLCAFEAQFRPHRAPARVSLFILKPSNLTPASPNFPPHSQLTVSYDQFYDNTTKRYCQDKIKSTLVLLPYPTHLLLNLFVLVPRMSHNNCVTPCQRPSFCRQVNAHLCHKHRINLPIVTTHTGCITFSVEVIINVKARQFWEVSFEEVRFASQNCPCCVVWGLLPVFSEILSIVLAFCTNQSTTVVVVGSKVSLQVAGYLAFPPTPCLYLSH